MGIFKTYEEMIHGLYGLVGHEDVIHICRGGLHEIFTPLLVVVCI